MTGNQLRIVDAALFMEYARAYSEGNDKLSELLFDRMRPEVAPAMNAWLASTMATQLGRRSPRRSTT
jgi:hypothetical protein